MRRHLRALLAILDGSPPPARQRTKQRGQSLVELTLVMPILLIMLFGLIEIGWLASNFMILLDVTREAGRFGAGGDPTLWQTGDEHNLERMDCDVDEGGQYVDEEGNTYLPVQDTAHLPGFFFDGGEWDIDYYDGVACALVRNMTPLFLNPTKDDVVISVFSYVVGDYYGTGHEVIVTGRYPARSNECDSEGYDPFDWNQNSLADSWEDSGRYDVGAENVRGFILTGHHEVSDSPGCLGSEFSTAEIQSMLNGASALENELSPNNGLLLVEIFWHHSQLLGMRWFTILGDDFELHVWSMFPSSPAEPTATPLGG